MKMTKPATSHLAPSDVSVILCGSPAHAVEHLVHAWDALSGALDESSKTDGGDRSKVAKAIEYAKRRCDAAVDATPRVREFATRESLRAECIELAFAIGDATRYF